MRASCPFALGRSESRTQVLKLVLPLALAARYCTATAPSLYFHNNCLISGSHLVKFFSWAPFQCNLFCVYSSLKWFILLILPRMGSFKFQSVEPRKPPSTDKSIVKVQMSSDKFCSCIQHENFMEETFCLEITDEQTKSLKVTVPCSQFTALNLLNRRTLKGSRFLCPFHKRKMSSVDLVQNLILSKNLLNWIHKCLAHKPELISGKIVLPVLEQIKS